MTLARAIGSDRRTEQRSVREALLRFDAVCCGNVPQAQLSGPQGRRVGFGGRKFLVCVTVVCEHSDICQLSDIKSSRSASCPVVCQQYAVWSAMAVSHAGLLLAALLGIVCCRS